MIKDLVEHAFAVYEHVAGTRDIDLLKNLLFKVAECSKSHSHPDKWARIASYRNHERYEHSSIFLEKHLLHSGDHRLEGVFATVSSTLLLLTD